MLRVRVTDPRTSSVINNDPPPRVQLVTEKVLTVMPLRLSYSLLDLCALIEITSPGILIDWR